MAAGNPNEAGGSASPNMEDRLARRKIDALKRGIHRIGEEQTMPFSVHVIGIGRAGANVVAQVLKDAPDDFLSDEVLPFHGARDRHRRPGPWRGVREHAGRFPSDRAQVETLALEVPSRKDLFASAQALPGVPQAGVSALLLESELTSRGCRRTSSCRRRASRFRAPWRRRSTAGRTTTASA